MASASGFRVDSRIVQLARIISESVTKLDNILQERGLPHPSFDEDLPVDYMPKETFNARNIIIDATSELHDLLHEPLHLIKQHSASNNSVCIQAVARYGIAKMVPVRGKISFAELGKQTVLGERMIRRLLRHAMTMRVFHEPEPDHVSHTQASRLLADPKMMAWVKVGTDQMWPAATKMLDALERWPGSEEPSETAFALTQPSQQSIYDSLSKDTEKGTLFAQAMAMWASQSSYASSHAADGFNWAALIRECQHAKGTRLQVVDVGGGRGHIASAIAHQYPQLDIIVQDMDEIVNGAESLLAERLVEERRVRFMAHDLFAAQTVTSDVVFLRWILHNWSDKYSIAILRAQIPALRPGARIIVMEACLPETGQDKRSPMPLWMEKTMRSDDLHMGAVFNARERTESEWRTLFKQADPRFLIKTISRPQGSALAIIELVWDMQGTAS